METPQYKVNWIFDTDPESILFVDEFKMFRYRWIHQPTGETNIRNILCKNAEVFVSLISRMNASTDSWYYLVI